MGKCVPADIAGVSFPYRVIVPAQSTFDCHEAVNSRDFFPGTAQRIAKHDCVCIRGRVGKQSPRPLSDFLLNRDFASFLGFRREYAPHHAPFRFEDITARQLRQLAVGTEAGMDGGEQEVTKRLIRRGVELLLIFRGDRQEPWLLWRLLQAA